MNQDTIQIPTWLTILAPPIILLLGMIVERLLDYFLGFKKQLRIEIYQQRRVAYSELMGSKFAIILYITWRFDAIINFWYHQALWELAGHPIEKNSLNLQEARRWQQRGEETNPEIARNYYNLFRTVGQIQILFPQTPELINLISKIYSLKPPPVTGPARNMNASKLDSWKRNEIDKLDKFLDTKYAKPIDDLLNYLASVMPKEKK